MESPVGKTSPPFHSTTKRCWALWDSLHLRNGVLHRKWESDDGKTFRNRPRGRQQLYNVGEPFERIAFDILGELPRSSDGNNNILVVIDYITKWPEAYPISNQDAPTVAEVLVQHWISRYGVPVQLHSDQGRNFDSAVCKKLCEILGIV
ncbi:retrovirus-related Pol polyprotein from transposon 412 [Trichonephila clavipes]|nr:retrovirus-related Pol polyprotein from transposon 412 [Trichonephila clavipes]